jgi:hypothetical protein
VGRSGPYLSLPVPRFGHQDGAQFLAMNARLSLDALDGSQDDEEHIVCEHALDGSLPVLKLVFSLLLP